MLKATRIFTASRVNTLTLLLSLLLCRRMFPSMRLSINGLEAEDNYCVLIEMIPISDCRFKFSGSQWVPAGGAEPQSPQRMYLHPDSPALGSHWTSQPVVFNKVKLTNNTLDSNGHVCTTSKGPPHKDTHHSPTRCVCSYSTDRPDQHAQVPAPHSHHQNIRPLADSLVAAVGFHLSGDRIRRRYGLSGTHYY